MCVRGTVKMKPITAYIDNTINYINRSTKLGASKKTRIIEFLYNPLKMRLLTRYQYMNNIEDGERGEIHAEVYLRNKAQRLGLAGNTRKTTSIYGLKRPCVTCAVRMEEAQITNFNKHHGRLFLNTTDTLTKGQACTVVHKLIDKDLYVTITRKGISTTHYDTDSD